MSNSLHHVIKIEYGETLDKVNNLPASLTDLFEGEVWDDESQLSVEEAFKWCEEYKDDEEHKDLVETLLEMIKFEEARNHDYVEFSNF